MEFLKEFLGDELYAQVSDKLKGNEKVKLVNLAGGEYVSKGKFDELQSRLTNSEQQIAERDNQLKELSATAGLSNELKTKLTELETLNKTQKDEFAKQFERQAFDFALNDALKAAKAKDIKSVLPHLDTTKLVYKDEKFIGLDEQIKSLTESKGFLFDTETNTGGTGVPGQGSNYNIDNADPFLVGFSKN